MADLDGLKKRVELIDLRLKTAHSSRERESAALMDMWEQIRDRFIHQNEEIDLLRTQVAQLEDTRDDLLQMVHGLLSAVEGGLERMSDETVPRIKAMAGNMLNESNDPPSMPNTEKQVGPADDTADAGLDPSEPMEGENFHDELLSAIEDSLDNVDSGKLGEDAEPVPVVKENTAARSTESASPGIRDLVSRIETAVGQDLTIPSSEIERPADDEDELARDLREIEALRGELHGLREKISST